MSALLASFEMNIFFLLALYCNKSIGPLIVIELDSNKD